MPCFQGVNCLFPTRWGGPCQCHHVTAWDRKRSMCTWSWNVVKEGALVSVQGAPDDTRCRKMWHSDDGEETQNVFHQSSYAFGRQEFCPKTRYFNDTTYAGFWCQPHTVRDTFLCLFYCNAHACCFLYWFDYPPSDWYNLISLGSSWIYSKKWLTCN